MSGLLSSRRRAAPPPAMGFKPPTGPFALSKWQRQVEYAVRQGATHVYIKAGRKAGKTEYLRSRIITWAKNGELLVPGQINAYVAPARTDAQNIMWRRLKPSILDEFRGAKARETKMAFDMSNGIRIQLFGADRPESIRGLSFGPSIGDECDFMRSGFFEEVFEPNLSVSCSPVILSSTPKNGWFTKKWRDASDGTLGRGHVAFHATIYDNPYISRSYIEKLRQNTPTEIWEQEYLANENAYCGLVYREFQKQHIVPHRTPPQNGKFGRSIDWGMNHPSHVLWAEIWMNSQTGRWNVYVYRELSIRGQNVEELSVPILAADARHISISIIDTSAKRKEMGTGTRIINEFARAGIRCRPSIPNDPYNINCVKTMLSRNDIQISEDCPILIKQLRGVEWNQDEDDDATDALKYLCGFVCNRDFTTGEGALDRDSDGKIDPLGLFAAEEAREHRAFVWQEEW